VRQGGVKAGVAEIGLEFEGCGGGLLDVAVEGALVAAVTVVKQGTLLVVGRETDPRPAGQRHP